MHSDLQDPCSLLRENSFVDYHLDVLYGSGVQDLELAVLVRHEALECRPTSYIECDVLVVIFLDFCRERAPILIVGSVYGLADIQVGYSGADYALFVCECDGALGEFFNVFFGIESLLD